MANDCRIYPSVCGKDFLHLFDVDCGCIPSRIEIVTLPTKLEYTDGESIDITGIVVKAYCEDGSEWGEVPFNELTFEPTVAELGDEWSDGDGINAVKAMFAPTTVSAPDGTQGTANLWNRMSIGVVYNSYIGERVGYFYIHINDSQEPVDLYLTKYNGRIYAAADSTVTLPLNHYYSSLAFTGSYYWYGGVSDPVNIKTFAATAIKDDNTSTGDRVIWQGIPESTKDPRGFDPSGLSPTGGTSEVTVTWNNADLDDPLTDAYEITVQ